jgi:hypothetical protein
VNWLADIRISCSDLAICLNGYMFDEGGGMLKYFCTLNKVRILVNPPAQIQWLRSLYGGVAIERRKISNKLTVSTVLGDPRIILLGYFCTVHEMCFGVYESSGS